MHMAYYQRILEQPVDETNLHELLLDVISCALISTDRVAQHGQAFTSNAAVVEADTCHKAELLGHNITNTTNV